MAKARIKRNKPKVNPETARQTKKLFLITAAIVVAFLVLFFMLFVRS